MKIFDEEIQVMADLGIFYLDDVFKQEKYQGIYGDMMDTFHYPISFLNKTVCGNGGTTGMIMKMDSGHLVFVSNNG